MRIGIDISQIAHEGTGVAEYTKRLVEKLLEIDKQNEYILFYTSLRRDIARLPSRQGYWILDICKLNPKVKFKKYKLPPTFLEFLWNRLHVVPIEWFIGEVDVFISSDWTQPPTKSAKKVTIIHDLSPLLFPEEHHQMIVEVQRRRLNWVKRDCDAVICDSEATKRDVIKLIGFESNRLKVIYLGRRR